MLRSTSARLLRLTILVVFVAATVVSASAGFIAPQALALGSCQADVSPDTVPADSESGFSFTVTGDDNIGWIRVTSPSTNLSIDSATSAWLPNSTYNSSQATFWGPAISSGNPLNVQISASVQDFPPAQWTVEAAPDQSGGNSIQCSGGDTSITVDDSNVPPVISNIVAQPQTTTCLVTWTTDKVANSEVDYGLSAVYTGQVTDGSFVNSHSLNLTGLTPNTTYHYQVVSADQQGHQATSGDNTFVTAAKTNNGGGGGGGGGGGSGGSGGSGTGPINVRVVETGDTTPPTVSLNQPLPKLATTPPTISGVADDTVAVEQVEYSTDGGMNWLPVDTTSGLGAKHVTFSFTPLNLDDDTYIMEVRAVNAGGKITVAPPFTVVIAERPPTVGGYVMSLGPQVLEPDASGVMQLLAGVDVKITLGATGGPTEINLIAQKVGSKQLSSNFALSGPNDSSLWDGTMSFDSPGTYQLTADAMNGAGTKTSRTLAMINVSEPGLALSSNGPVAKAWITVYYLDPDTNGWVLWDGSPFGQPNPQATNSQGSFKSFLPAGTYYINATAGSDSTFNSSRFTLGKPTPVAAILHMKNANFLSRLLTSWFGFGTEPLAIRTSTLTSSAGTNASLVGTDLADFSLTDTLGNTQNPVDWLGRPTDLCIMTTWAPTTAGQLNSLNQVAENKDVLVVPVGLQENADKLRAYNAIAGSSLPWLADPNNALTTELRVGSLPTHYFLDRRGIIQAVVTGILSPSQITEDLARL